MGMIDRFIIIHKGLLPIQGLDEGASIDELSEYILYYYDEAANSNDNGHRSSISPRKLNNSSTTNARRVHYPYEAAIRFAGLCNALYTFPNSFRKSRKNEGEDANDETENDYVKEVDLTTCTLIFIPLETSETNDLVAIAQFTKPNSSHEPSFNPNVVRHYITATHGFYQLLKYGGIHRSLASFDMTQFQCSSSLPDDSTYANNTNEMYNYYPGMNQLYHTHKMIRKSHEKVSMLVEGDNMNIDMMNHKICTYQNQLYELNYVLPIGYIRYDLKVFYDWIIGDYNGTSTSGAYHEHDLIKSMILPSSSKVLQLRVSKSKLHEYGHVNKVYQIIKSIELKLKGKLNVYSNAGAVSAGTGAGAKTHQQSSELFSNTLPTSSCSIIGFSIFGSSIDHVCTFMKPTIGHNNIDVSISTVQAQLIHRYFDVISTRTLEEKTLSNLQSNSQQQYKPGSYIYMNDNNNPSSIWILPLFLPNGIILHSAMYRQQNLMDVVFYSILDTTNESASSSDMASSSQVQLIHSLIGLGTFINDQITVKGDKYKKTEFKEYPSQEKRNYDKATFDIDEKQDQYVKDVVKLLEELGGVPGIHCLLIDRSKDQCMFISNDLSKKNKVDNDKTNTTSKDKNKSSFKFLFPFPFWPEHPETRKENNERNDDTLSISDIPHKVLSTLLTLMDEMDVIDQNDLKVSPKKDCDWKEMLHFTKETGWYFSRKHTSMELYVLFEKKKTDKDEIKQIASKQTILTSIHDVLDKIQRL